VRIEVRAKPRAKKSRILGWREGSLSVALAAPPIDGAANDELVRLLSDVLGVPKRQIVLMRGESSRTKLVDLVDVDPAAVRALLEEAAAR
jgi:hypothetical protein